MNDKFKGVLAGVGIVAILIIAVWGFSGGRFGISFNEKLIGQQGIWVGSPAVQIISKTGAWLRDFTNGSSTTLTGDVRVKSPVLTGASSTLSGTTSTAPTAAEVCDGGIINVSPSITAASTTTLPTAASVFADCLTTAGDEVSVMIRNLTASTTAVVAGTSSTLVYTNATGASATLAASGYMRLTFQRLTDTLLLVYAEGLKP